MKNAEKIFDKLASLSNNYTQAACVGLIAEIKDSGEDEATQNEFISVAQKTMSSETKRIADVNALIQKYGNPENIDPADDEEDDYY
ncbi:MAG: hypothetical protein M0R51_12140 [Clostridia bacterium]|nr:hypothetical protein [Clostridia bacterium]